MFGDVSSSPRPPSKSHKVAYLQCGSRGHQFRTSRDLKTGEDSLHCEAVQPSVAQKQFQFGPGKAALRREWWPFRNEDHLFRAFVYIYIFSLVFFGFLSSLYCAAVLHFLLLRFSVLFPSLLFCLSAFPFFLLLCIFAFLCFLLLRFFVCFSAFLLLCFFAYLFFCLLFLCFLFSAVYFFCIRCFLFFYLLPCCSA